MGLSRSSGLRIITSTVAAVAIGASGVSFASSARADNDSDSGKAPTSISIRLEHHRVAPGASTDVLGNLKIAGTDPEGREVSLEAKSKGADGFTPVATVTARDKGGLTATITPEVTTKYRWSYEGSDDARAHRSGVVMQIVRQKGDHPATRLPTSLSIRALHRISGNDGDTVQGRLTSRKTPLPHRRVVLTSKRAQQDHWHFAGVQKTSDNGRVRFGVQPHRKTAYRLVFLGTQVFRPSRSGIVHVAVRSHVSIHAAPRHIDRGDSTTVTGKVTHEGDAVSGATVDLLARASRPHATFHAVGSTISGDDGSVTFSASPGRDTTYRLKAHRTAGAPGSISRPVHVTVRYGSSLSIRGRDAADAFVVTGLLRGHGHKLVHRTVTLEQAATSGSAFTPVGTDSTNGNGVAKFKEPSTPGASYRLTYAGGGRYSGSTSGIVVD